MLNEESVRYIRGMKGLRQGDPFSPLLFVIEMDYLTRKLKQATKDMLFRFHPGCKKLSINNLCFADDLLLFSKGITSVVQCLRDAFQEFSRVSGLIANISKSNIYFGGVAEGIQNRILKLSGFSKGIFPMRYLGFPLSPKKWSKLENASLVKKITERISC